MWEMNFDLDKNLILQEDDTEKILYNCTECSSMIEIININEDTIKFRCIDKKHEITLNINEYLKNMKKYNNINLNNKICDIHNNNEFISYCFDCNRNICKKCLKSKKHFNHIKNNIIEVNPTKEELKIIEDLINKKTKELNILNKTQNQKENYLNKILNKNINKLDSIKQNQIKKNKDKLHSEIKANNEEYIREIKKLKDEYNTKFKNIKNIYINNINILFILTILKK